MKPDKERIPSPNDFLLVGIGASAGGLDAFKRLLRLIPENSGMAYVVVQHLSPDHESVLPELLQKITAIPVLEITDDIKVKPDHIYIIPSNKMLEANDGVLQLSPRPSPKEKLNLPIDLFFTSLAEVYQENAIGVVLSGTASDGTQGLKAIKDHGGITFAQDDASATFGGMPLSAIQSGVVDFILSPEGISKKLLEIKEQVGHSDEDLQHFSKKEEHIFKQILSLLHIRKSTDFTYYKQTTIRRRILRRMALNKNDDITAYFNSIKESGAALDILYQDLLIPVTEFFRDSVVFDQLCNSILPEIVKNKSPGDPIRIWIAGCSTGEEAYSIAICVKEFLGEKPQNVQIFATDLSEPAIAKARSGIYTKDETKGAGHRLQEFFTKTGGKYQLNKVIRDMCVFAVHNFLKDPPFGKIDLVTCRNVLIYLEPYLQKKALTTFHYALNPKGILLLGKSETNSAAPELFTSTGKHNHFIRKDGRGKFMHVASPYTEQKFQETSITGADENRLTDYQKASDQILLSKYIPACIVVNESKDIVQFRGKTSNYLEFASGKPSHNLLKMAKSEIVFELRKALLKAWKENIPVVKKDIPLHINDKQHTISIEVIPLTNMVEKYHMVIFHDQGPVAEDKIKRSGIAASSKTKKDIRIQQLEIEVAQVREDMRNITDDQEVVNEELQSANEELLSGSEELQSLNEELETSKEELQSSFEELTVVNQELLGLNQSITEARDYSEAIVSTVRTPLLVLDKYLRVVTANDAYYKAFKTSEPEIEGRLIYELGDKQWDNTDLRKLLEEILPRKTRFTDFEIRHSFPVIGQRVMILDAREITRERNTETLILLSIEDITEKELLHVKEKEFQQELTIKIEERTQELKVANIELHEKMDQLVILNKELESFTYISSHDLQEPLRKIQTFSKLIIEKEQDVLSDKGKDYFKRIQNAAARMQELIEDILAYSRTDAVDQKLEDTDLSAILEDTKMDFAEGIRLKEVIIESTDLCTAHINPSQFRQVMNNLVGNAIKFSKPGVSPYITVKGESGQGIQFRNEKLLPHQKYCHISVSDNGIGFEDQYKEQIFEMFQRLHDYEEYPGTGIGLAIVKKIIEHHHGIITATGVLDKGSTFDIYIPQ